MSKNLMTRVVAMALGLVAVVQLCHAATLTTNDLVALGTDGNIFNISVYPGSAAYTSSVTSASGVFGDGTVVDYRFVNGVGGVFNAEGYTKGTGLRVLAPTNATSLSFANRSEPRVWTTTDPGGNFSSSADHILDTIVIGHEIKGEVDISGMYTGSLYFVAGQKYNSTTTTVSIAVTMSGPGQPDISVSLAKQTASQTYLWEFMFGDASAYDKLSYVCNLTSTGRGRFMGLILDGEEDAIFWYSKETSNITRYDAEASAIINAGLDAAILVWDTTDKGDANVSDWAHSVGLGAVSAGGTVTGQMTGLDEGSSYTWRMYGSNSTAEIWSHPVTFETDVSLYSSGVVLINDATANYVISVYPGKARYSGNIASGIFCDGTVVDYRFFNNANPNNGYVIGPSGLISAITYSGQNTANLDYPQVWTVSDPDSLPADYTSATMSGNNDVDGTIDISGLISGTVYILCGQYNDPFTVSVTMSGSGPARNAQGYTDPASKWTTYAAVFSFINDGTAYDTISYNYLGGYFGRSRFMGVILDGEEVAVSSGSVFRFK